MSILKQQVMDMLSSVNDERLLTLIKADIEYFDEKTDIIDELSEADQAELIELANEPAEKDTITREEFNKATARWRTK